MRLEVVPLTPERLPDLAALFGQGGDPKRCWCSYFRVRSRDITSWSAAENRLVLEEAVVTTAREGRAPGLLAYDGSEIVGWASLGPRDDYPRVVHSRLLEPVDDAPVWSIVCFVVGRRSRGRGIATALLSAAIEYARGHGASILEAYPSDVPDDARVPSATLYRGTLRMFERAGFVVVARRQASAATLPRPIVRLAL